MNGVPVTIGGKTWVVPPHNQRHIRKYHKALKGLEHNTDRQQELMIEIVFKAVRRNYPDLTREAIEELVDLRNLRQLCFTAMGIAPMLEDRGINL